VGTVDFQSTQNQRIFNWLPKIFAQVIASDRYPSTKFVADSSIGGFLANGWKYRNKFFLYLCLGTRLQVTDFHVWWLIWCGFMQGCAFWGLDWYCDPFSGSNHPNKDSFEGVNSRFQAKRAKYWNFSYYLNYCTNGSQILRSDRDHQVLFVGCPNVL